jgi:hypothetical protein
MKNAIFKCDGGDGTSDPDSIPVWVILECSSQACRSRVRVPVGDFAVDGGKARLEAAIRCSCGGRGGRLYWGGEVSPPTRGPARCYLFHA